MYSLIFIHHVEKNSPTTAVVIILNYFSWNTPMFYKLWCWTNAALMRTSTKLFFFSNYTAWVNNVHLTWPEESIFEVIHFVRPPTIFAYKGCLSKLCHDGWDGRESEDQTKNALISVSTAELDGSAGWVLNAHSTKVSSLKSYSRFFFKLLPTGPAWPLLKGKVYLTFTVTLKVILEHNSNFINWFKHHLK